MNHAQRGLVTVEASASGHDAVTEMIRNNIRHPPVVGRTGTLSGIAIDRIGAISC